MPTINYTDTARTIVNTRPDGSTFIVEYASVWEDERCIGSTIIAAAGPIYYGDLWDADMIGEITDNVRERVRDWELMADDADWLNLANAEGVLGHPYGGSI